MSQGKSEVEQMIQSGKSSIHSILLKSEIIQLYKTNNPIVESYLNREKTVLKVCSFLIKTNDDAAIRTILYIFLSDNRGFLKIFSSSQTAFETFFSVFQTKSLYKIGMILELFLHSYAIFPQQTDQTFHSNVEFVFTLLNHIYYTSVVYYMKSLASRLQCSMALIWYFFTCIMEHYGNGGIMPELIYLDTVANLKPVQVNTQQRKAILVILNEFLTINPNEKGMPEAIHQALPILIEMSEDDEELSYVMNLALQLPENDSIHIVACDILKRGNRLELLTHSCLKYETKYFNYINIDTIELMIHRLLKYKSNNLVLRATLDLANAVFPRLLKDNKSFSKQIFNIIINYISLNQTSITIAVRAFCSNLINILKGKNSQLDSEDFRLQVLQIRSVNGKLKVDKDHIKIIHNKSEEIEKQDKQEKSTQNGRLSYKAIELWGDNTIEMQRLYRNFPNSKAAKKRMRITPQNQTSLDPKSLQRVRGTLDVSTTPPQSESLIPEPQIKAVASDAKIETLARPHSHSRSRRSKADQELLDPKPRTRKRDEVINKYDHRRYSARVTSSPLIVDSDIDMHVSVSRKRHCSERE